MKAAGAVWTVGGCGLEAAEAAGVHLVMHGCAQGPRESLHHPNTNAGRVRVDGVPPLSRSRRPH